MIKIKELRQKSKIELEKILKEDKEKIRGLRFNLAEGKVKNVRDIRKIKKEIARILTIKEKENHA